MDNVNIADGMFCWVDSDSYQRVMTTRRLSDSICLGTRNILLWTSDQLERSLHLVSQYSGIPSEALTLLCVLGLDRPAWFTRGVISFEPNGFEPQCTIATAPQLEAMVRSAYSRHTRIDMQ
jgi:hypothetical protein